MALSLADRDWIEERAREAGFDLCGVTSVAEPSSAESLEAEQRFAAWVAAGYAGEMEYLKRQDEGGNLVRGGLRRVLPWARSVIVCAINYNSDAPLSIDPAAQDTGWIARYAWSGVPQPVHEGQTPGSQLSGHEQTGDEHAGSDYHDVLLPRLRQIEERLRSRFDGYAAGQEGGPSAGLQTRCYVDTGPLLERGYAARAGVGWIGRNTCILNQEQGSWLLLGVIITSLELAPAALSVAAVDRCGSCTRCIDACPTDALMEPDHATAPRMMDASRCIAYLTIEKKGSIEPELRAEMGRQIFGCDICQDVCPWNRKRTLPKHNTLPPRRDLINPELEWLAAMDGPAFNRWFRASPLQRTRRKRILRNVAIAMGNSGRMKFLPRLVEWTASEDPVLAEAAMWALARLQDRSGGDSPAREEPGLRLGPS